MKNLALIYFIFYLFGCTQTQKKDGSKSYSTDTIKIQQRLIKKVSHPVPKLGFNILADSMFVLCSQVYGKVPKGMDGYCYLDIHLFVDKNGNLADVNFYCSKLFGDYFKNQNDRITFMLKFWHPAIDKASLTSVSYSINILSEIYAAKHVIVFSNIQNDTLAIFSRSR